jgi:hypothetical protein
MMAADPQIEADVAQNLSGTQAIPARTALYRHPRRRGGVSPTILFHIPVAVGPDGALIFVEDRMPNGAQGHAGNCGMSNTQRF